MNWLLLAFLILSDPCMCVYVMPAISASKWLRL